MGVGNLKNHFLPCIVVKYMTIQLAVAHSLLTFRTCTYVAVSLSA